VINQFSLLNLMMIRRTIIIIATIIMLITTSPKSIMKSTMN